MSTPDYIQNEFKEFENSSFKLRNIKMPTNIPITILASFKGLETKEDFQIRESLFNDWQKDAPQMKIIKTEKSGHYVHRDEPELVINEILNMIDKLKTN